MKIYLKLILGFISVLLLLATLAMYSISVMRENTVQALGTDSAFSVKETLNIINDRIFENIDISELKAQESLIRHALEQSNSDFDELDDIDAYIDEIDSEWVLTPEGEETAFMKRLIENNISDNLRDQFADFWNKKRNYTVFEEVFITNKYGANVAQTQRTTDYYQADEEWWEKAKEDGIYISSAEFGESVGKYSISIGMRIDDEKGEFIGVMKAVINVVEIMKEAEIATGQYQTSIFYVTTKDGSLVFSSKSFKPNDDLSQEGYFKRVQSDNGFFIDSIDGNEELVTYAHSEDFRGHEELDFVLIVSYDTDEVLRPVYIMRNNLIMISIALIISGILVALFISRSISMPISHLRNVVTEIGKGRLNTRIIVESNDEIGDLATAFRTMTEDLKKSRDEIKRHTKELENKVDARTKGLGTKVEELTATKTAVLNMMEDMDEANKQLVKTQHELKDSLNELKEMDVKKDQFISIAAHELKTPLTSIHGFSQLLQDKKVADNIAERAKYLRIMDHETRRLAKLVNDILDLSRIDLGTVKLNSEPVDVKELLQGDIKGEMKMQIEKKGLKSEFIAEPGLTTIVTDKEKLTEILINLITNAMKYTNKGKITVNVFKKDKDVHFVVKDTGIGISKENLEKVFERFYQVDSSYTREYRGVGLGLALCKEFVALLGGKIWVKSELGKGSEFHFSLPIKGAPAQDIRKEELGAEVNLESQKAKKMTESAEMLRGNRIVRSTQQSS
ncbi:MAG: HAMP domain-containing protein [Candidatus Aenigmarchaeota archaeon]|nr:HAMP domain-containing protein [Candidatus Aenigmarchaeota archaeon]